jgi:hypothetical protein
MIDIPIELPRGWTAERYDADCVTLYAPGPYGRSAVTINVKERSFVAGVMRPRRTVLGVDVYRGRGWQAQLYTTAVEALQGSLNG